MQNPFRHALIAVAVAATTACVPSGPSGGRAVPAAETLPSTLPARVEPERADAPAAAMIEPTRQASTRERVAAGQRAYADAMAPMPAPGIDRENYAHFDDNGWQVAAERPVSTFSIDVDTGSYSNVRRMLNAGRLPPMDAVRAEEMINYFDYAYDAQPSGDQPFSVTTETGPSPWNPHTRLLHVGIRGVDANAAPPKAANLVFLVDVSGSMSSPDKLDLLKAALKLLVGQLGIDDRISIVTYAGAAGVALEPVAGSEKARIRAAIDGLSAGGSTHGAAGIELAYAMARQGFVDGGINRILLATDGDFNVGTVNFGQLVDIVERERTHGVSLTTLGFGTGNYNDHLMEQLADAGDGNHAYIDTLNEARRVLVEQRRATLETIAADVKIQVEFNPAAVAEYRLIGYENRLLDRADFNNDRVDAGEIGAGHTVTALYEFVPAGSPGRLIDPLRYDATAARGKTAHADELAFLKLRYKTPGAAESTLITMPVPFGDMFDDLSLTTPRYRFSAAVAAFAQRLRGGENLRDFTYADVLELARGARGDDPFGYRGEFLSLVALAASLGGGNLAATR